MNLGLPPRRRIRGFDMTPMIDVVLQLIIFFLFTSQFSQMVRTPIDLPVEHGEESVQGQRADLVVDIDRDGRMLVETVPMTLDEVDRLIRLEIARLGDPSRVRLLLRADRKAAALHVNRLADRLAALGVRDWSVGTTEPGGMSGGGR